MQLLVAERDVLGRQARVAGGEQVLAVEPLLGGDLGPVERRAGRPWSGAGSGTGSGGRAARTRRAGAPPARPSSWRARAARRAGRARPRSARAAALAAGAVAFGLGRVVADDVADGGVAVADPDLLDAQVVADAAVAALAGERLLGLGHPRAQLDAGDVVAAARAQPAQVVAAGEAGVDDVDRPAEPPAGEIGLHLLDQRLVVGVARPHPHPDRDPLAGDREPDHHLRQVGPVILRVARAAAAARSPVSSLVVARVVVEVDLEVGRGGVEEDHVDLEVEQVARPRRRPTPAPARSRRAGSPSPGTARRRRPPRSRRTTTSRPSQRVASSFEAGSRQRWQTIAKIARSTPERPRPRPATRLIALPIPSCDHNASSACGPPDLRRRQEPEPLRRRRAQRLLARRGSAGSSAPAAPAPPGRAGPRGRSCGSPAPPAPRARCARCAPTAGSAPARPASSASPSPADTRCLHRCTPPPDRQAAHRPKRRVPTRFRASRQTKTAQPSQNRPPKRPNPPTSCGTPRWRPQCGDRRRGRSQRSPSCRPRRPAPRRRRQEPIPPAPTPRPRRTSTTR